MNDPVFEAALSYTLAEEGGWSNHPSDRGGATKYGITLATLQRHMPGIVVTPDEVHALTMDEARDIYRADYWLWCPEHGIPDDVARAVPAGVRIKHFDTAVNCGPHEATRMLQLAVNEVRAAELLEVDGIIGLRTATGAAGCDASALLAAMSRIQLQHYEALVQRDPSQSVFINGWKARAQRLPVAT